jgi:hypothetical protein
MDTTDSSVDNPTRRTDLRTVEPHYSAVEVYAALDCPYPGTGDDRRAANSTAIALHSYREPDKQSSGKTTDGRNRYGQSVPSTTTGINASPSSSDAAVRRRTGFSGFESDDNARHNDDGGTMKTNRHHDTDEPRGDHDADATALLADGGDRLDLGTRVVDRDADDPNTAVVVDLPDEPAYAYTIDAFDGEPSVADLNPDYGASAPVASVVFLGDLSEIAHRLDPPEYQGLDGEGVAEWFIEHREETDATAYTYPIERLREVSDE